MFQVLRLTVGLRVSPELEKEGLSIVKEFTKSNIEAVDESILKEIEEKYRQRALTEETLRHD